jgi:hypothetical protein
MPVATLSASCRRAAAAGPMTGERKPKMPANVSPAEAKMLFSTAEMVDADAAAAPTDSAPVRAATPAVTAAVFAGKPERSALCPTAQKYCKNQLRPTSSRRSTTARAAPPCRG